MDVGLLIYSAKTTEWIFLKLYHCKVYHYLAYVPGVRAPLSLRYSRYNTMGKNTRNYNRLVKTIINKTILCKVERTILEFTATVCRSFAPIICKQKHSFIQFNSLALLLCP